MVTSFYSLAFSCNFLPSSTEKGEWQSGSVGASPPAKLNPPQCQTGREHFWKHTENTSTVGTEPLEISLWAILNIWLVCNMKNAIAVVSSYEPISDVSWHCQMWHLRLILRCRVFLVIFEETACPMVSKYAYFQHLYESSVWVREMRSCQHTYLGKLQEIQVHVPSFSQAIQQFAPECSASEL